MKLKKMYSIKELIKISSDIYRCLVICEAGEIIRFECWATPTKDKTLYRVLDESSKYSSDRQNLIKFLDKEIIFLMSQTIKQNNEDTN